MSETTYEWRTRFPLPLRAYQLRGRIASAPPAVGILPVSHTALALGMPMASGLDFDDHATNVCAAEDADEGTRQRVEAFDDRILVDELALLEQL